MKKIFVILLLVSGLCLIHDAAYAADTTIISGFRTVNNNAFGLGERLSFEVGYGFITAAEAFMTVSPAAYMYNGRETYEINFDVNSRSSFDVVYKVRDNYKTYIDKQGIFPWRYEQHIRENDYKHDFEATFIQESLKVYTKVNFVEDKNYQAKDQYVQDLISSFYYARTMNWKDKKEGDVVRIMYFYKDGIDPLDIRFEGRETISVAAGEFKTFILHPMLKEGLTSKTSDLYIYLSDDDRKIPVKVKVKIVIGSLVGELTKYEGLAGPLDARIGD